MLDFKQIVLARQRAEDPEHRSQWSLRAYEGLHVDLRAGPVSRLSR